VPRFVIIAGEASGDQLASGLIHSLRKRYPDAEFEGITGAKMRAAGCESWGDVQQLAVMGIFEVVRHLPRLWRLNREIQQRLLANPPDVFVGIDAPDFNLRLERFARGAGIPTVHYVCPSVWAWRPRRVKKIRAACDLVLCLLPFEPGFLHKHNVPALFVGHPLADEIDTPPARDAAREKLQLPLSGKLVALLPGSRMGEVAYLGPAFVDAAVWLLHQRPQLRFIVPAATPAIQAAMHNLIDKAGMQAQITVVEGHARDAMAAADSVLLASGTATLETMLVQRSMVVAYKVFWLTAWLLRKSGIVTIERFSLPNLLADAEIVPEILQEDATGSRLGEAVLQQLEMGEETRALVQRFRELGAILRRDANEQAAKGIAQLIDNR
jgi:lipid-A-disaccharide synthase